jgi:hypothetical protein
MDSTNKTDQSMDDCSFSSIKQGKNNTCGVEELSKNELNAHENNISIKNIVGTVETKMNKSVGGEKIGHKKGGNVKRIASINKSGLLDSRANTTVVEEDTMADNSVHLDDES